MRRYLIFPFTVLVGTVLTFWSGGAQAQFFTPIRYNEGPGVKLTDSLVFHPGIAIETRYDNNPLATNALEQAAAYLRLIAHLDLATLSPQRLTDGGGNVARQPFEFRLKGAVAYREYFSDVQAVKDQRAIELDAGMLLKYAPSRVIEMSVNDDYSRQVMPLNTQVLVKSDLSGGTLQRNLNRLQGQIGILPGGGRLNIAAGYALNLDAFENDSFSIYNKIFHEAFLRFQYKLLPKTSVSLEAIQQFYDYYNTDTSPSRLADNVESTPLRVYAGLSGLITARLSAIAKIGYGNSFYDSRDDFNSVLAKAELGYQIGPTARAKIGYERRFDDSFFANFFTDHVAYAGYDHQIAQRVLLHLLFDYRYRQFEGFPSGVGITQLDMNLISGGVGIDYQIQDWVYVGVGYDLQVQDISNGPNNAASRNFVSMVDFTRHQVFGRVGVSY